jgi:hypothetical protein
MVIELVSLGDGMCVAHNKSGVSTYVLPPTANVLLCVYVCVALWHFSPIPA